MQAECRLQVYYCRVNAACGSNGCLDAVFGKYGCLNGACISESSMQAMVVSQG